MQQIVDTQASVRDEMGEQAFRQRLAAQVEAAESRIPVPAPLAAQVQRQVDTCLARLCVDTGALHAVLIHRSGTLIGEHGPADRAALVHWSKALASVVPAPQDLTELRRYKSLLMDDLFTPDAWLLFWPWSDWFVLISGPAETIDDPDTIVERLKSAARELTEFLPATVEQARGSEIWNL